MSTSQSNTAQTVEEGVIPVVRRRLRPVEGREPRSRLRSSAWLPKQDIDYAEWEAQGRWLGSIGRCSQWWIGDWVRFGTAAYGEKYSLASQLTGYDEHSLRNIAYVASRFGEASRRREELSFSHHAELAPLSEQEQDRWLDRVQSERLSVATLRRELRAHRRGIEAAQEQRHAVEPAAEEPGESVCCPNCGHRIQLPVDGATSADREGA